MVALAITASVANVPANVCVFCLLKLCDAHAKAEMSANLCVDMMTFRQKRKDLQARSLFAAIMSHSSLVIRSELVVLGAI